MLGHGDEEIAEIVSTKHKFTVYRRFVRFLACSSTQWSRIAFPSLLKHQEQFLQLVKNKNANNNNNNKFQFNCCNIVSDQAYRHITSYAEN